MTKAIHFDVLDKGPTEIKTAANILHLVPAATAASYAATVAASILSSAMATGDYAFSTSGSNRVLTTTSKTSTASGSAAAAVGLEWRFCDSSTSRLLWQTNELSGAAVASGSQYSAPVLTYTTVQPV